MFCEIFETCAKFQRFFAKYEQNLSEVLRNFSILSKYWARGRISPEIIIGIWVLSGEISKRDMGLLKRNIGYGQIAGCGSLVCVRMGRGVLSDVRGV